MSTTIQVSDDVKRELDTRKLDSESYSEAVARLLDDNGVLWRKEEVRSVSREVAREVLMEARR